MTNIALLTLDRLTADQAPTAAQEILTGTKARMGMVPNMYEAMANSSGLLGTYLGGYAKFREDSGFDAAEQETVFLAISHYHECGYCMAAHSTIADKSKVAPETTEAIRDGKPIADAKLQALNEFTTTMVASRGRPTPEELAAFLAAGYREQQVLEIILAIAVKTISNHTNHLFDTPVDAAFARRSWTPASR